MFKKYAPFINCKSEINNIEIDNAKDIDKVMPMHNLIRCTDNYFKICESLWQYYRNEPNDNLADSESVRFEIEKQEIVLMMVIQRILNNCVIKVFQ